MPLFREIDFILKIGSLSLLEEIRAEKMGTANQYEMLRERYRMKLDLL